MYAAGQNNVRFHRRLPFNLNAVNINPMAKYPYPIPLSEEKKADLRRLMEFLLPEHRAYYLPFINA